jgi:alkanesulfonate monooxygenase SsuD/methylene tetrahydromethanopterin reductase-like flavin-dependent oxidoreductase (luciferase family)
MLEIGIFHNGASELPCIQTKDGTVVNKGTLAEVHAANRKTVINQVRQGILADKLGFNYFFMSEHHFQVEGAEFSPNPLVSEAAIATRTSRIRLGQAANIITWWHPVRIAEQAAMVDILSNGRLELGIGRGYQPRETEVFGWPYATIQDQERNRAFFDEAYRIILDCWTKPSFFFQGQFYTIPPVFTRWNHKSTFAYFGLEDAGRTVDEVLRVGGPDPYGGPNPVLQSATTLKELSVFPQPAQKPYPQIWQPLTTPRSIRWAAEHGVNGYFIVEPNSRLRRNIELYYEAGEKAGWPDRLNRGRPKFGWDAQKRRGIVTCRYIHLALPGKDKDRELKRYKLAMELQWDYYGPFGFAGVLAEADEPPLPLDARVEADLLLKKEVALFGSPADVAEKIVRLKEYCGYEDLMFHAWFEKGGFSGEEIEEQMQYFAEEVTPLLARACGGKVENPELGLDYDLNGAGVETLQRSAARLGTRVQGNG